MGYVTRAVCALFFAACSLLLFLPFPRAVGKGVSYPCEWEDGRVTEESFSSAYASMRGYAESGEIVLLREGTGVVRGDEEAAKTLLLGSFAEILSIDTAALSPLTRVALERFFKNTIFYADGYYTFTEAGMKETAEKEGERAILFSEPEKETLKETGVRAAELREGANLTAEELYGSGVEELSAAPPYASQKGALYLDTVAGRRLVAGLPKETSLTLDMGYADDGALYPCRDLMDLTMPLATDMVGSLFLHDGIYDIPPSLKRIKLTRGRVDDLTFYACRNVEEVDLCGLDPADILPTAFRVLPALRTLVSSRRVALEGFAETVLPCGCFKYEKDQGGLP